MADIVINSQADIRVFVMCPLCGEYVVRTGNAWRIHMRENHIGEDDLGWEDNFDNNEQDAPWVKIEVAGGVVTEQNERLECLVDVFGDMAGYVSRAAVNLIDTDISVDTHLDSFLESTAQETGIHLATGQTTADYPYNLNNWYRFYKDVWNGICVVQRKVDGGAVEDLCIENFGRNLISDETLQISIRLGMIYFYQGETLIYAEHYALDSYALYVYLYCYGGSSHGTSWLDNFSLVVNWTNTGECASTAGKVDEFGYVDYGYECYGCGATLVSEEALITHLSAKHSAT